MGKPAGDSADIGRELATSWSRVCGVRQHDAADNDEFLSSVQEWNWPRRRLQRGQTQALAEAIQGSAQVLKDAEVVRCSASRCVHSFNAE